MLHVASVKTDRSWIRTRENAKSRIANNYRFNCDKKKKKRNNPEKRELSRCFRIVVPRQIVDIVMLTVAESAPPIGRYIGYQSTIQTVDAESSRSEILSHEGKQNNFCAEVLPGFRISDSFAGFLVFCRDIFVN